MRKVDLKEVVNNAVCLTRNLTVPDKIKLEWSAPEENYFVKADPVRLNQVIVNLITNAIKFNKPEGSVRILAEKEGNDNFRLEVHDTGRGISDERKDLVFMPFERLDSDSLAIGGTGIGLTGSKHLIELMNGRIGCEAVSAKEAPFWQKFPAIMSHPCSSGNKP